MYSKDCLEKVKHILTFEIFLKLFDQRFLKYNKFD